MYDGFPNPSKSVRVDGFGNPSYHIAAKVPGVFPEAG